MKNFAELLNRLFFTYSHIGKTILLNDYFATTPDPERGYALAVMAGTLNFPNFKRSLIKELLTDKIDLELFHLSYDYVGDLSETVALLWPKSHSTGDIPTLTELVDTFNTLPTTEYKNYLTRVLNKSNATERWALLKLGTGELRIGVSARFLKQALAQFGNKNIEEIEHIWHAIQPPYNDLFAWLENKSQKPDIENSIYFHPVMLSHPLNDSDIAKMNFQDFYIERKYDGIRVQVISTALGKAVFSRTGDEISSAFPDVTENLNSSVVLDGELVIQRADGVASFNDLQQRLNRKKPSAKLIQESPAHVILYDILFIDGIDLRSHSLDKRRDYLEAWFAKHKPKNMTLSDVLVLENHSLHDIRNKVLEEKHVAVEGIMLKRKDSAYIAGRPSGLWYKWKRDPGLVDAVLMYAQRGSGKRSSYYSDFTFGLWKGDELLPIGKAYFGFTDEELAKLDKWIRNNTINRFGPVREVVKEMVFEVAFDAVSKSKRHKSGYALRFPRISRIRWDKPASEADQLDILESLIEK